MSHILIAAAVPQELEHLIDRMEIVDKRTMGCRPVVECNYGGTAVLLIETGPGAVNTAQALTAVIEGNKPVLIVQTGCAGAFAQSDLSIGDIGIATEDVDVHIGLESRGGEPGLAPLPFPLLYGHPETSAGRYAFDPKRVEAARKRVSNHFGTQKIQVQKGPFITVSTITATDGRAERLYARHRACMEAMEGSAAAHVALLYRIPLLEIRAASNLVGNRDRQSWDTGLAFERAAEAVCAVVSDYSPI